MSEQKNAPVDGGGGSLRDQADPGKEECATAEPLAALVEFARYMIQTYAWDRMVDGGDVQDRAVALGLLVETTYDPEKHGENDCGAEPGDQWFEFSSALSRECTPVRQGEGD